MNLFDALRPECVAARLSPGNKQEALQEIVRIARRCPLLDHVSADDLLHALIDREKLGSTGFGKGIAIPHCRMDVVREFVIGLASIPAGVPFDALDGEDVTLMAFIIAPAMESNVHVRLLSGISQVLMIPGSADEMVRAPADEALVESFLRHVRDKVDTSEENDYCLLHVFVQNEGFFKDIVRVFGATQTSSAVILDAENSSAYLYRMPMFAGFWSDNPRSFSRLIVALVAKPMANETIRQIEEVTGSLKSCQGVLVTVQDLHFCAGSLDL